MKYALANGQRQEARPNFSGECPACSRPMVAKCGEVKIWHWAHKGRHTCDPWWENETEWHRAWKERFPIDWQEVVHQDKSGEKHIADVKTTSGWVLEFQHSYLNPKERRSRNAFYGKLVWVVNGLRRPTDKPQFQKVLSESTSVTRDFPLLRVSFPDECRLLKEWQDSSSLVFFDFEGGKESTQSILWFLFPTISARVAYLSTLSRKVFIELQNNNEFEEFVRSKILPIRKNLILREQTHNAASSSLHPNDLLGFRRHMAYKAARRRRF